MAKSVGKTSIWDGLAQEKKETHNHTHTQTHTHTPTHKQKIKETKERRVQLLTYASLVDRMDAYGESHGLSRAEVFEKAVSEFLERNT